MSAKTSQGYPCIECELDVIQGAFHGFDVFDHQMPLVQDFRRSQIAALKQYLFQ